MAEAFFGSIPQPWPTTPLQALGYVAPPLPPVGVPPQHAVPAVAGVPMFAGAEFTLGTSAPALLMAVALRRGQPLGPTSDQEAEDFICDALDLVPGAGDVEVRCEGGRVTLTGTVPHKRLKRDVGEIAWTIASVNDVQNNVTIAARRRMRAPTREPEPGPTGGRKPA